MGGRRKKQAITLAFLGIDNAGKSTILASLRKAPLEDVTKTVGFVAESFKFKGDDITVFDLGGGKRIRDIWPRYYAEVSGVVFVVDAGDRERLEESKATLATVLAHEFVAGKPLLILANKQDMENAMSRVDVEQALFGEENTNEMRLVQECQATNVRKQKADAGVRVGLAWLLDTVYDNQEALKKRLEEESARQQETERIEREAKRERVRKQREEREAAAAAAADGIPTETVPSSTIMENADTSMTDTMLLTTLPAQKVKEHAAKDSETFVLPNSVDLPEERKLSQAHTQPPVSDDRGGRAEHAVNEDSARRPRSADTAAPDVSAASDNEPAKPRVQRIPISELVRDEPSDAQGEDGASGNARKAKKSSDATGDGEKGDEEERPPPEKGVVAWLQSPLPPAFGSTAPSLESPSKPLPPPRVRSAQSPPAALNPIRVAPAPLPAKLTLAPLASEQSKSKQDALQHENLEVEEAVAESDAANKDSLASHVRHTELTDNIVSGIAKAFGTPASVRPQSFQWMAAHAGVCLAWDELARHGSEGKRFNMERIATLHHEGWASFVRKEWDEESYGKHPSVLEEDEGGMWRAELFLSPAGYTKYLQRLKEAKVSFEDLTPNSKLRHRAVAELLLDAYIQTHPHAASIKVKQRSKNAQARLVKHGLIRVLQSPGAEGDNSEA